MRPVIGAGFVLAVVAVVAALLQGPAWLAGGETVRVRVPDASELTQKAEVRVAGVGVGEVTGRRRVPGGTELELRLDDDAPTIHRDARVEIRPRLLFEGNGFVDLSPGSPSARPLGDRALPLSRAAVATSLQDVLGVLDAEGADDVRAAATTLRATFAGAAPDSLQHTLKAAPRVMERGDRILRAARGRGELRSAIAGLHRTTAAVASQARTLPDLAADTATVANAAAADASDASAGALDATLRALPEAADRVMRGSTALRATVAELAPTAKALRPGAKALAPALEDVRPLLRDATAVGEAAPLVADVRAALADAAPAAPSARKIIRDATPTLETLDKSLLPALNEKTRLGTPAYLSFLGLFAGGGGASRPFGTSGDGHLMRFGLRFLTGLGQPLPPCDLLKSVNAQLAATFGAEGACTP
jgi:ABC-type transporter Mla subunit MlaD